MVEEVESLLEMTGENANHRKCCTHVIRCSQQCCLQQMPIQCAIQDKFEEMKTEALQLDSTFHTLPALECGDCGKCVTFGGCSTFLEKQFTVNDLCKCNLQIN